MFARQCTLPFPFAQSYAPEDFFPGDSNAAALAWLEAPAAWPSLRLAVHGEAGTGKTHLLRYFAGRQGAAVMAAGGLRRFAPPPEAPALGIDDADQVRDPEALLHVLNAAAERGSPVLLTARTPPAQWPFALPDLVSRLRAMPSVGLLPPDDGLLRAMLARLLAERQIAVPERVQAFLLARLPRTGNALRDAAARLDCYALAEGGPVTTKLAERVVAECNAADREPDRGLENTAPGLF
jgi:chromosomal replication initiation ATPase DnaA